MCYNRGQLMNGQHDVGRPPATEPIPQIAGWMAAAQPLQLLMGGLFVFLINAAFEFFDRPLIAAVFFAMALLTVAVIPLESWLVRFFSSAEPPENAVLQISRIYQTAIVSFVVGATLTVIVGGMSALWLVFRLALALGAVKIVGEIWWVALNRRIAKPR
jgi:hypothetical protein